MGQQGNDHPGLFDEAETHLDFATIPEQNDLQRAWVEDGRYYEEKHGEIEVGGQKYQFRVSFVDLRIRDSIDASFSTNKRVITEVAPNLGARNDIIVPVLPGWGETSAQFEGDFLDLLLEVLHEAGCKNPKVIGINCSGRGTPEYLMEESRGRISGIGLMDEVHDAANIAQMLMGRGYFGDKRYIPNVVVIGHSMGFLNSAAFLNVLNYGEGPGKRDRDGDLRVKKLLSMMPAVDGPFAMVRARFLWAVRKQVMPALQQAIPGKGALELDEADYHRIMFGDEDFRDFEQFARSVPDSAKRFLQLTLNTQRRFGHIFRPDGTGDGVDLTVWKGGQDRLIPDNAVVDLPKFIGRRGLRNRARVVELPNLSHSIPFRLRDAQMLEVRMALEGFFAK